MAAVLTCGNGAVLSHVSAGAHWGIVRTRPWIVHVSVQRRTKLHRPGIRVHARPTLVAVTRHEGIPLTQPVQTLIDLATELPTNRLERAVNEADKLDLVDPEALREALDHHAGEPGVKPLRALLDKHTFRLSDTELEVLFRPLAAAAGLPVQLTKQVVNGFEVDFHWPDLGLVVETDGLRYHRTAAAQTRDAKRDQTHTAAGLTRLRFTHWQVKHEPAYVREVLARTRGHLARRRGS
jgi:very-short-patch-repair endonuclease